MELQQYVKDAVRTESRITEVTTDAMVFARALVSFIAAGNVLDMMKKNIFYRKPIDATKFANYVLTLRDAGDNLPVHAVWTDCPVEKSQSWKPTKLDIDPRVFHAMIGAMTESAEIAEALYKTLFSQKELDGVNLLEEFGDINWYQAIAIDALNGDFNEILERNIAKLKARFPDKYNDSDAVNRNLEVERAILEGKQE